MWTLSCVLKVGLDMLAFIEMMLICVVSLSFRSGKGKDAAALYEYVSFLDVLIDTWFIENSISTQYVCMY